jgi:hypothetical protein
MREFPLSKRAAAVPLDLKLLHSLAKEGAAFVARVLDATAFVDEGNIPESQEETSRLSHALWELEKNIHLNSSKLRDRHEAISRLWWKRKEDAEEDVKKQRWHKLQPLAAKLIARLEPMAAKQDVFGHPRWELDSLKKQVQRGYQPGLVHQLEYAIMRAYWVLKGIPEEEGWKRSNEGRTKEQERRTIREKGG